MAVENLGHRALGGFILILCCYSSIIVLLFLQIVAAGKPGIEYSFGLCLSILLIIYCVQPAHSVCP